MYSGIFPTIVGLLSFISFTGRSTAITFDDVENTFNTLQTWYNNDAGLWMPSTGWWNSAVCLNMLAKYASINSNINGRTSGLWRDVLTKAPAYNTYMTQSFGISWMRNKTVVANSLLSKISFQAGGASDAGFINGFYDDEGWWALAWIAVYDLTQDQTYLDEAITIFNDMHAAYNTTPVGGLWWDKDHTYVNAIANELYLSVAAHLANRCPGQHQYYSSLAEDSWNWFYASGMINSQNNIEDGLAQGSDPGNTKLIWSYNQGVILSGLTELARATSQTQYVEIAKTIADAALAKLTSMNNPTNPSMILHEICEDSCGTDGSTFKGIFARNLAHLHSVSPEDRYGEFLMKNSEALWQNGRDQYNRLGLVWNGPFIDPGNASTQCSGMDLFVGTLAQLGEWTGNGTYTNGKVSSQSTQSDVPQDSVSQISGETAGMVSHVKEVTLARVGSVRAKRGFFGLW